ncbi:MAG: hypothetical protein IPK11_09150 [Ignavibacteria bacterium]|nr:hypothetical protein [Ignavibacteria bacterium]
MSPQKNNASRHQHGIQHYIILLGMIAVFSYATYNFILPTTVQGIVVSLFKPEGEHLHNFSGVIASPSAEGKKIGESHTLQSGEQLKKYINNEYIFDFTTQKRIVNKEAKAGEQNDGYTKQASEWYLKAPKLGEEAIILEPNLGFSYLAFVIGAALSFLITLLLPNSLGIMAAKVSREIDHTKDKIRLQTGFSQEVVDILTMPGSRLRTQDRDVVIRAFRRVWNRTEIEGEHHKHIRFEDFITEDSDLADFRDEFLYIRIKEFFSDFVLKEIEDVKEAFRWESNHLLIFKGLRLYMSHHFTEKYSNSVTGLAYAGAAILIVIIGVRGLKFIPPTRPSLILGAIFLEGSMLALLAFVLMYTESEERMDKMMKKMEDASRSQVDTLEDVAKDMHQVSTALVEGNAKIVQEQVEKAVTEYLSNPTNLHGSVGNAVGKIVVDVLTQGVAQKK